MMNDRRSPLAREHTTGLSDREQIMLSALAGAFTGFLIWLYYVVFRFAIFVIR